MTTKLYFALAAIFLVCDVPLCTAEDFDNPAPPPELGETLTSYKTRQQLLDEAVREAQSNEKEPEIRIYRKVPDAESNVASSATVEQPSRKVIPKDFSYSDNHQFYLYKNARILFNIVDGSGISWPIKDVEASNRSIKVTVEDNTVIVSQSSSKKALGTVKLYLPGKEQSLDFVISGKDEVQNNDYAWKVTVPYPSPNNENKNVGYTNLKITSKARNSLHSDGRAANNEENVATLETNNNNMFSDIVVGTNNISKEEIENVRVILMEALSK